MKRSIPLLVAAVALGSPATGQDTPEPPKRPGELRVYLYDDANRPLPPPADVRLYLEPRAGGRRTLRPAIRDGVAPVTSDEPLHHGGQIQRLRGGGTVELVIVPPGGPPVAPSSQAHLAAGLELVEYVCPMKCASDVKPGDCPKCGMEMLPSILEFDAVVALKRGGEWTNAKGFRFPPIQPPKTLREAVEQIAAFAAEIKARVDEGKLDRVHTPALAVAEIGKLLRALATEAKVDDAAIAPLAKRLEALGPEIDKAADAACTVDTVKLLAELQNRLEMLRALAR